MQTPPDELTKYLNFNFAQDAFHVRRRAVLSKLVGGRIQLACCAVEAFPDPGKIPQKTGSIEYENAVLFEDWLTKETCREFISALQNGTPRFGDIEIDHVQLQQWQTDRMWIRQRYMLSVGAVVIAQTGPGRVSNFQAPLVSPVAPYYPDIGEATSDWLGFPVYNGESDSLNGNVIFLLPEARAFFKDAVSDNGELRISMGGSQGASGQFIVKGAYWEGRAIRQLSANVVDGIATLTVPDDVLRLDYLLLDEKGAVYDAQYEGQHFPGARLRRRVSSSSTGAVDKVLAACRAGEGMRVEFKPFVNFKDGDASTKAKFHEYLQTIVAFANSEGGTLYIGVDDECVVHDISREIAKWAKAEPSPQVIERFCGALKNTIKSRTEGELTLEVSDARVDGNLVLIIDVSQAGSTPVGITGDHYFYVRTGASNRRTPPSQWASEFAARRPSGPTSYYS